MRQKFIASPISTLIFGCILSFAFLYPSPSFAARKSTAAANSYKPVRGAPGDPTGSSLKYENSQAKAVSRARYSEYQNKQKAYKRALGEYHKSVKASREKAKQRREEDYQRRRAEWEKREKARKERLAKIKEERESKNSDKGGEEVKTSSSDKSKKDALPAQPGRKSTKKGTIWGRMKSLFGDK